MDWYYVLGDKRQGPVSDDELRSLAARQTIDDSTLVWREGMKDWAPYSTSGVHYGTGGGGAAAAVAAPPRAGYVQCVECDRSFPQEETLSYRGMNICATCKPVFFQRIKEGGALPGEFTYGGFWIRFGAKILDGIIMYVAFFVLMFVAGMVIPMPNFSPEEPINPLFLVGYLFISFLLPALYSVIFVGRYGATPGKMAAGLKIVRPDGSPVSYLRALGRYFAEMLSGLIIYVGYLMAAFDEEKRSLHDRICDTRVIRSR